MEFNTEENRDAWFEALGFTKSVFFDKDVQARDYDDTKYVEYNYTVFRDITIDVTFIYSLIDSFANKSWLLVGDVTNINMCGFYKMNISTADELKAAVEFLTKLLK